MCHNLAFPLVKACFFLVQVKIVITMIIKKKKFSASIMQTHKILTGPFNDEMGKALIGHTTNGVQRGRADSGNTSCPSSVAHRGREQSSCFVFHRIRPDMFEPKSCLEEQRRFGRTARCFWLVAFFMWSGFIFRRHISSARMCELMCPEICWHPISVCPTLTWIECSSVIALRSKCERMWYVIQK